jgi:hypothetical protein
LIVLQQSPAGSVPAAMKTARTTRIDDDSPFCDAHVDVDDLIKKLTSAKAMQSSLTDIERLLAKEGTAFIRGLLQSHIDARCAAEETVDVVGADGVARPHVRMSTRTVETPFGEVSVTRRLYRAVGVAAIAPMDAALGLAEEKYTLEVRRIVAEECAKSSFDEVVELIEKRTGASVPKRQVEELSSRSAQDFDEFYATRDQDAEASDDLLVLSFDGKGVAMRHEDLREATRKAAEATPRTLHSRLAKGEKPNRKRMAQVAAIYSLPLWRRTIADVLHGLHDPKERDAKRPRPINKRVWASVEHGAQQVVDDAFAEGLRRDPERKRRWVVLVDGQEEQLRRVQRGARKAGVEITIQLDVVHVLEYLWRAAYAFHPESSPEAEKWVEDRFLALLSGRSGGEIAKSLRGMIVRQNLDTAAAKPVVKCANYLVKNTRWLHYDRALADGLPIATGVIEGACRYLVQDRMGRTGARWSLVGAEAVLRLRALRASGDFDDYWQFHLAKEHERTHASHYADGAVPDPVPPSRAKLRLVK